MVNLETYLFIGVKDDYQYSFVLPFSLLCQYLNFHTLSALHHHRRNPWVILPRLEEDLPKQVPKREHPEYQDF